MAQTQDRITQALELLQEPTKTRKVKKYILPTICLLILCVAVNIICYIAFHVCENFYEDDDIILRYVPEGFTKTICDKTPEMLTVVFERDNSYFYVSYSSLDGNYSLDTENSTAEPITINKSEGMYIKNPRFNAVMWFTQENYFEILGNISKAELIKIAENFVKK